MDVEKNKLTTKQILNKLRDAVSDKEKEAERLQEAMPNMEQYHLGSGIAYFTVRQMIEIMIESIEE